MKHLSPPTTSLVLLTLLFLGFPENTRAYLDPGTGSYIVQLILAGLLGGVFAAKVFWKEIKAFFKNLFSRKDKDHKDED